MTTQKIILGFVAAIAIGLFAFPAPVMAQQERAPGGTAVIGATATAKVLAIDAEKRIVTLQKSDGEQADVKCGKEVRNFDQIKVGDEVKAAAMARLVVFVGKGDAASSGAESEAVIARAPKGAMPGVIIANTEQVTAKVDTIDTDKQTVTLSGLDAEPQTVQVAPDVDLSKVKAGDDVTIRVTKGMALWVSRPGEGAREAAGDADARLAGFAVESASATATVEAIDREKRKVTLKAADGGKRVIHLGKEAINFDQIEVGDKVRATLGEEAVIAISKGGEAPGADATQLIARAPEGSKPRLVVADSIVLTGQIKLVDADKRTVTLIGADGAEKKIKAGPKVNLSELKAGDNVTARVTQVLAIVVEKP